MSTSAMAYGKISAVMEDLADGIIAQPPKDGKLEGFLSCRQLNYRRRKSQHGNYYIEELVADGRDEAGRNWSLTRKCWLESTHRSHYVPRVSYSLKVDVSEFVEGYHSLWYNRPGKFFRNEIESLLAVKLHYGEADAQLVQFTVMNQSPGIWENGFNPNYWLEAEIAAFKDEKDQLEWEMRHWVDLTDLKMAGMMAKGCMKELGPGIEAFRAAGKAGVPYHHWWGIEKRPEKPREPVWT